MADPLPAASRVPPPVDAGRMLRRGLLRRCPRCGGRDLFRTWWSIRDRCPRCGLRSAREEGYFTGVYLVNLAVTEGFVFVVVMGYALWRGTHPDTPLVGPLVAAGALAVVLPVLFYPVARTLWAALDLAMTPLTEDEARDAAAAVRADPAGPAD